MKYLCKLGDHFDAGLYIVTVVIASVLGSMYASPKQKDVAGM